MGQRGEIFSTRIYVDEGKKTYFFNIKENRYEDRYLNIVESRKAEQGFKRNSIVVFEDNLDQFLVMLDSSVVIFRSRSEKLDKKMIVGEGRRTYFFHSPNSDLFSLEITESREDATGSRRESIRLLPAAIDLFLDGLDKAVKEFRRLQK